MSFMSVDQFCLVGSSDILLKRGRKEKKRSRRVFEL